MTKLRTSDPWMAADAYGRTLGGLTLNLLVRSIERSLPFYSLVLELTVLYSDVDYAALERNLERGPVKIQLHADHTYDQMPWYSEVVGTERRGQGAEFRILGIDPDSAERLARQHALEVVIPSTDFRHGWRACFLRDPDGYLFAVGVPTVS